MNKDGLIVSLKIAIPRTTTENERRVAASPETVKNSPPSAAKCALKRVPATACSPTTCSRQPALKSSLRRPRPARAPTSSPAFRRPATKIALLPKGSLLIGILSPYKNEKLIGKLASAGVNAFAMELMPRITRAQSMDVLSSQSNLAGYKAVLDAAEQFTRAFPMMMTAAGTVAPARFAGDGRRRRGIAGDRHGTASGRDRLRHRCPPAVKEQVASLGATFVAVEDEEFQARPKPRAAVQRKMSPEYKAKASKS